MIDISEFEDGWYTFEETYTTTYKTYSVEKQSCLYIAYKFGSACLINSKGFGYCIHGNEFLNCLTKIRKLTQDELTIKDIIE